MWLSMKRQRRIRGIGCYISDIPFDVIRDDYRDINATVEFASIPGKPRQSIIVVMVEYMAYRWWHNILQSDRPAFAESEQAPDIMQKLTVPKMTPRDSTVSRGDLNRENAAPSIPGLEASFCITACAAKECQSLPIIGRFILSGEGALNQSIRTIFPRLENNLHRVSCDCDCGNRVVLSCDSKRSQRDFVAMVIFASPGNFSLI
jgi:hypothetical protein